MPTTAGGIGVLVVVGLMAVGYSEAGWGSTGGTAEAGTLEDGTSTCDGVLVVDSATGPARVPADTSGSDGTATAACTMRLGRGGEDAVSALQQALVQCHGQPVTVDGAYGPETAAALTAVQRGGGITADGEYGPATAGVVHWPVDGQDGVPGTPTCDAGGSPAATAGDATSVLPATG